MPNEVYTWQLQEMHCQMNFKDFEYVCGGEGRGGMGGGKGGREWGRGEGRGGKWRVEGRGGDPPIFKPGNFGNQYIVTYIRG